MSTELEKALERSKYAALPLPRANSAPTTIFAFDDGHLYIVRNPHSCLPDPPIAVTVDPAVDTLEFSRQFGFELKGVISFVIRLFGMGNAKAELEAKDITSATVQMGGLSHHTIETGALVDYLLSQPPTPCQRDLLDRDHFTIVAALQATTFTYTFKSNNGLIVKFSAPEAGGLFQAAPDVNVSVTEDGRIVVNAPRFVGVVTWDGQKIQEELAKARQAAGKSRIAKRELPSALDNALDPRILRTRQLASLDSADTDGPALG